MVSCDDHKSRQLDVVEQSVGISYDGRKTFTANEVLGVARFLNEHTFVCPLCRKISFPEVGMNAEGEIYMCHSEVMVTGINDSIAEFLPKRACVNCKPKLTKMTGNLNSIIAKIKG